VKSVKGLNQQICECELEEYYRGKWEVLAKDPQVWLRSAQNLKTATDALRKSLWPKDRKRFGTKAAAADFIYGPVYMLLSGLAIETLLKGIIIAKNPKLVKQQKLSNELTHHKLIELYNKACLVKSRSRNDLLSRLQNYVENFGRYPVTKTKQDMQKLAKTRFAGQTDPDSIERLWGYLFKQIRSCIQGCGKKDKETK